MKVHRNAQKLIDWLREHQPATVKQMAASCMMNARDAADAGRYCVRHGVLDHAGRPGTNAKRRVHYRLTGRPLPALKAAPPPPSFDGLPLAWGIARTPPHLPVPTSCRHELQDWGWCEKHS
jgi:hypothetical protein